jgi:hypothetical protein
VASVRIASNESSGRIEVIRLPRIDVSRPVAGRY